ncbi:MAG TPA: hypothetical protein VGP31_13990 [Planosporangium sp.]|jgi:hypothetical protein|nr:hypothetical protein [Planosporangium sp.]
MSDDVHVLGDLLVDPGVLLDFGDGGEYHRRQCDRVRPAPAVVGTGEDEQWVGNAAQVTYPRELAPAAVRDDLPDPTM